MDHPKWANLLPSPNFRDVSSSILRTALTTLKPLKSKPKTWTNSKLLHKLYVIQLDNIATSPSTRYQLWRTGQKYEAQIVTKQTLLGRTSRETQYWSFHTGMDTCGCG